MFWPMKPRSTVEIPVGGKVMASVLTLQPVKSSEVGTSGNQCSSANEMSVCPLVGVKVSRPRTVRVAVAIGPSATSAELFSTTTVATVAVSAITSRFLLLFATLKLPAVSATTLPILTPSVRYEPVDLVTVYVCTPLTTDPVAIVMVRPVIAAPLVNARRSAAATKSP